jgi:hypothetical protein
MREVRVVCERTRMSLCTRHAHEMHTREVYAHETHAREIHAREMHEMSYRMPARIGRPKISIVRFAISDTINQIKPSSLVRRQVLS